MVIIETPIFTRLIKSLLSDDNYRQLQESLIVRPDCGSIIQGSGGLRKMRWKLDKSGKSGGIRVIYYWVVNDDKLLMVHVYGKSQQDALTSSQLSLLKQIVQRWSDE